MGQQSMTIDKEQHQREAERNVGSLTNGGQAETGQYWRCWPVCSPFLTRTDVQPSLSPFLFFFFILRMIDMEARLNSSQ